MPPLGDGKKGEEGKHEASCNEFRPSLIWSATEGWALPTVEGHTSCDARLIFPRKQAGSTTGTLAARDKDSEQNEQSVEMDCDVDMDLDSQPGTEPEPEPAAAGSTTLIKSAEGDRDSEQNVKSVKMDCDVMESSDSISSFQKKVKVEKRELNVMHEDTVEAAVIDLQELVTKVKWMQRLLLQSPSTTPSSWKFV